MKELIETILAELVNYTTKREERVKVKIRNIFSHDEDLETRLKNLHQNLSKLSNNENIQFQNQYLPLRNYSKNVRLEGLYIYKKRLPITKQIENIAAFPFVEEFKNDLTLQLLFILMAEKDFAIRRNSLRYADCLHSMLDEVISTLNIDELIQYTKIINSTIQDAKKIIDETIADKNFHLGYVWQYPEYREIIQSDEKITAALYKEGYHKTTYYVQPRYSTYHDEVGGWKTDIVHIGGSGTNIEYFYPNREKVEDFKHIIKEVLIRLQHLLVKQIVVGKSDEVNQKTKYISIVKITPNKNEYQILSDEKINKLRSFSDGADKRSLIALLNIYQYLTDKFKTPGPKNVKFKKELNHFEDLLNAISQEPSQKIINQNTNLTKKVSRNLFLFPRFNQKNDQSYEDCCKNLQLNGEGLNDETVNQFVEILKINQALNEPLSNLITLPNSFHIEEDMRMIAKR